MKSPTELLVQLDFGIIRVGVLAEANTEAREILAKGLRVWNEKTRTAVFYPAHRIMSVEATWGE